MSFKAVLKLEIKDGGFFIFEGEEHKELEFIFSELDIMKLYQKISKILLTLKLKANSNLIRKFEDYKKGVIPKFFERDFFEKFNCFSPEHGYYLDLVEVENNKRIFLI